MINMLWDYADKALTPLLFSAKVFLQFYHVFTSNWHIAQWHKEEAVLGEDALTFVYLCVYFSV